MNDDTWPRLDLEKWNPTYETVHRWTQIVGKVRLNLTPFINHFWNTALYVTSRGLTTSPIPAGDRSFEIRFDFVTHNLIIEVSDGSWRFLPLEARAVASFYDAVMGMLRGLGINVHVWTRPVEIPNPIPFDVDREHGAYEPLQMTNCFQVLSNTDQILKRYMGGFVGKQSPSHFFWGSFDLAQSRFSGRPAPLPADADFLRRACYSNEVMSVGFWPGEVGGVDASFYAYVVPEPRGFSEAAVHPDASYSDKLKEFLLPYEAVRSASNPSEEIFRFFHNAYDAAAELGEWDRDALDAPTSGQHVNSWRTSQSRWLATAEETP